MNQGFFPEPLHDIHEPFEPTIEEDRKTSKLEEEEGRVHQTDINSNTNTDTQKFQDSQNDHDAFMGNTANIHGEDKMMNEKNEDVDEFKYAMIPSCNAPCLSSMGKDGNWVQDWEYAKNFGQFPLPWVIPAQGLVQDHEMKFQPDIDAPFPWRTSWKWVDEEQPTCHVGPMTHELVCHILAEMGVDRIAFYGDSLTELQYQSFINMMGPEHTRRVESTTDRNVNDEIGLVCPQHSMRAPRAAEQAEKNVTIPIFFRRPVNEASHKQVEAIFEIAEELHSFVHRSDHRLLGIFNIGAHYLDYDIYHEDVNNLLNAISSLNRTQDLYFFRTTSPGHDQCEPRNPRAFNWTKGTRDVPFTSIEQLKLHTGKPLKWSWDKFQFYNKYTKGIIQKQQKAGKIPMIHVLDVYNMTALRNDGHRGGVDCLHYATPGPVDWWNNLLFSYLHELSRALQRINSLNCSPW